MAGASGSRLQSFLNQDGFTIHPILHTAFGSFCGTGNLQPLLRRRRIFARGDCLHGGLARHWVGALRDRGRGPLSKQGRQKLVRLRAGSPADAVQTNPAIFMRMSRLHCRARMVSLSLANLRWIRFGRVARQPFRTTLLCIDPGNWVPVSSPL